MLKLLVESTLNEFVETAGGELIEKTLPNNDGLKRADYLFRSPLIVAELKCLEHEIITPERNQKLGPLAHSWMRRRLIPVQFGGTQTLELRKLPKICQDEWLELYEKPIQRILEKANQQIKEAKGSLGLLESKGVLLVANERQFTTPPEDLITFIARILQKKKPDGKPVFSNLHHVVLFSINVQAVTAEHPGGIFIWLSGYRDLPPDPIVKKFLTEFGDSLFRFCAAKRGHIHAPVQLGGKIDGLRFVNSKPD